MLIETRTKKALHILVDWCSRIALKIRRLMLSVIRMNIFRFVSVIAWKPLSFRQGLLARTISGNGFATQNGKSPETNVVVPKAYQLRSRKKSGFANDDSSHKIDREISKTLGNGFSESEKGTVKAVSAENKDIYNATFEKLPKKPPGLFGLFVKENYSKVQAGMTPGISAQEVMPALSNKWRNLPHKEKERLKQKQQAIQEEYKQHVISFRQGLSTEERAYLDEKHGPKMRQLDKERRHFLGYPKSPPSPFILFMHRSAEGLKSVSVIERAKMLGQKWKEMSEEEKETYFEENRKAHEQYNKDIAKWKEKYSEVA